MIPAIQNENDLLDSKNIFLMNACFLNGCTPWFLINNPTPENNTAQKENIEKTDFQKKINIPVPRAQGIP